MGNANGREVGMRTTMRVSQEEDPMVILVCLATMRVLLDAWSPPSPWKNSTPPRNPRHAVSPILFGSQSSPYTFSAIGILPSVSPSLPPPGKPYWEFTLLEVV